MKQTRNGLGTPRPIVEWKGEPDHWSAVTREFAYVCLAVIALALGLWWWGGR